MANHSDHHDHHSDEKKPVAFTVPLIFASVVVLIIVMLVSLGDPKHGVCECKEPCSKECMEACEKGGKESCEQGHGDAHATEAHATEAHAISDSASVEAPAATTETAAPAHAENHH